MFRSVFRSLLSFRQIVDRLSWLTADRTAALTIVRSAGGRHHRILALSPATVQTFQVQFFFLLQNLLFILALFRRELLFDLLLQRFLTVLLLLLCQSHQLFETRWFNAWLRLGGLFAGRGAGLITWPFEDLLSALGTK